MDQLGVLYDRSHRASSLYEAEQYKTADALCESILADPECSPWLKFEVLSVAPKLFFATRRYPTDACDKGTEIQDLP